MSEKAKHSIWTVVKVILVLAAIYFGAQVFDRFALNSMDRHSDDRQKAYDEAFAEGYAAGYDAGYKAAMDSRTMPDITPAPTARATPKPTTVPSEDFTVFVSRNGVIHKKSNCSGMIYYHEMLYSETKGIYEKKCSKCFK